MLYQRRPRELWNRRQEVRVGYFAARSPDLRSSVSFTLAYLQDCCTRAWQDTYPKSWPFASWNSGTWLPNRRAQGTFRSLWSRNARCNVVGWIPSLSWCASVEWNIQIAGVVPERSTRRDVMRPNRRSDLRLSWGIL
jgi:hypothetical protein